MYLHMYVQVHNMYSLAFIIITPLNLIDLHDIKIEYMYTHNNGIL